MACQPATAVWDADDLDMETEKVVSPAVPLPLVPSSLPPD
jgi:hypothetical protein